MDLSLPSSSAELFESGPATPVPARPEIVSHAL